MLSSSLIHKGVGKRGGEGGGGGSGGQAHVAMCISSYRKRTYYYKKTREEKTAFRL